MKEFKTDVAIVGAGPVGLFMVFEAGMLNMSSHVVDILPNIGGQCSALYPEKPIYDIPAYPEISGQGLSDALLKQCSKFDPVFHLSDKVVSIEKTNDSVVVNTLKGKKITAKVLVIAAGSGAFGPNRPPIKDIEQYEDKSIFYHITNQAGFADKEVVIAGGGDSAVDWAISLEKIAKKVSIVHRRSKFRCAPASQVLLNNLVKEKRIELVTPYQLESLVGDQGNLHEVIVSTLSGEKKSISADYLLPFFGLSMKLGPILEWGVEFENNLIKVDPSTMKTSIDKIYAIGDICTYKNKLKLILNGFAECSMAAHDMYHIVYPDTPLHFEYSTTKGKI